MDATAGRHDIGKPFSIYLDLLRFMAALAVFVGHSYGKPFSDGTVWWRLATHGTISVTVFFVLSGYVIAYVAKNRERTFKDYFIARISRLYSVVGVALVLTFALDQAGMFLNPDFYAFDRVLRKPESWAGYLSSLFFVNEYQVFGFHGIAPGTNGPYWSMSFEATYYVIAGLFLFCRPAVWLPVSAALLWLAGSTIAAMLPLWLSGFWLFCTRLGQRWPRPVLWMVLAASALALVVLPWSETVKAFNSFGFLFPWSSAQYPRNLVMDYLAALVFSVHLLAARALLSDPLPISRCLEKRIRWLGSLTFPLYLLHQPLLCLLTAWSPFPNTGLGHLLWLYTGTLAVVVLLTPVCDLLKEGIRRFLDKGLRNHGPDLAAARQTP